MQHKHKQTTGEESLKLDFGPVRRITAKMKKCPTDDMMTLNDLNDIIQTTNVRRTGKWEINLQMVNCLLIISLLPHCAIVCSGTFSVYRLSS